MLIRKATFNDVENINQIYDEAKAYFKSQGIDQWQNGYPNTETLKQDIEQGCSYLLIDNDEIIGTCYICFEDDPYYAEIEGSWLNDAKYGVIHRIAIKKNLKGKGYASQLFEYGEKLAKDNQIYNLRVDTHENNLSMQRLIGKNGYEKCGIVYVMGHSKRLAFQKVINN